MNEIGIYWLRWICLPETKPKDDTYRLILLDGDGSYISGGFLYQYKQNRVQLVWLPAQLTRLKAARSFVLLTNQDERSPAKIFKGGEPYS
jgi:hypothetical protein